MMKLLTPARFGELVELSARTVVELCAAGRLPGARKLGRQWRIPEWSLDVGAATVGGRR